MDYSEIKAPDGMMVPFRGDAIPDGWQLCDGTNGTPDLRGRVNYMYPPGTRAIMKMPAPTPDP